MSTVGAYEAKTHLPALLERVAGGKEITITKHGVPVAVLVPANRAKARPVGEVVDALLVFRKGRSLKGLKVRELIEEGRR
jgi:prevent-host-death family protein